MLIKIKQSFKHVMFAFSFVISLLIIVAFIANKLSGASTNDYHDHCGFISLIHETSDKTSLAHHTLSVIYSYRRKCALAKETEDGGYCEAQIAGIIILVCLIFGWIANVVGTIGVLLQGTRGTGSYDFNIHVLGIMTFIILPISSFLFIFGGCIWQVYGTKLCSSKKQFYLAETTIIAYIMGFIALLQYMLLLLKECGIITEFNVKGVRMRKNSIFHLKKINTAKNLSIVVNEPRETYDRRTTDL